MITDTNSHNNSYKASPCSCRGTPCINRETHCSDRKTPCTGRKTTCTDKKTLCTDRETPCTDRETTCTDKEKLSTDGETPYFCREILCTDKETAYSDRETLCTAKGLGISLTEEKVPSNGAATETIGAVDGEQQVMARTQKQVKDQSVQTENDLKFNGMEKSDLNETQTNEHMSTKQNRNLKVDLPQAGAKHQTIKEYFSNLSPAVAGDLNMWQERARIEKEILKNKMEGKANGKYQLKAPKDIQRKVNTKRKLQFKDIPKSINKIKEIHSEKSSDNFHCNSSKVTLSSWLEDLSLPISAVRKLEDEELELEDMLELMSRDDLCRIGLKKGPELRIWQKVQIHRQTREKSKILLVFSALD